jgi:twitching motility protein PilT
MKATPATGEVVPILNYADPDLRLLALGFLEAIDDPTQAATIAPLLHDADHRIRGKVRELLIRWHLTQASQTQVEATNQLGSLERLLVALVKQDGDDLILAGGQPPFMKKIGRVVPLADRPFSAEEVRAILLPTLTPKQIADLEALKDVDFSFELRAEGLRFRANVFQQASGLSAVLRVVKNKIPVLEELGLPPIVRTFGEFKSGLVLVGGPTGSGKSTTLAGIIDYINRTTARHIFTIEDPVEVVHTKKRCLVNQRELGAHTLTFDNALRATLRQDADVILVGEMRDLPTIQFAITAAETGCLVLGTIHTVSVDNSVDRLVSAFPPGQQSAVRGMLADSLRAVMCQFLLKRKDGQGRVLAAEIMLNNDAIASLVRKGKAFQIPSVIATQREAGMQSMDWELERLFKEGKITAEEAYMKAANKKNFEWMVEEKGAEKEKPSDRPTAGVKGADKDRKANPSAAA